MHKPCTQPVSRCPQTPFEALITFLKGLGVSVSASKRLKSYPAEWHAILLQQLVLAANAAYPSCTCVLYCSAQADAAVFTQACRRAAALSFAGMAYWTVCRKINEHGRRPCHMPTDPELIQCSTSERELEFHTSSSGINGPFQNPTVHFHSKLSFACIADDSKS